MSIPRRIVKGSAEALAWGKKMREIRRAGKKTERAFFGPRGVFAKAGQKKNPGEAWHEGMEHVAARYGLDARTHEEKLLFKGVEVAHRDSKKAARRLKMNPRIPKTCLMRKNPLAVFSLGNPPTRINTGIAGVVYNVCHEIRAEKTGYKKGLYRHPFSRKSGVQILALDNGDLLIHSTRKVRLWKPS